MKRTAIAITLILSIFLSALSGIVYFGTVHASADGSIIPEPSVPEFTAKAVATTIEVTIKNQPLTSYENGSYPSLYYGFRFKDHNAMIGFWNYDPTYFVLPSTYGTYYKSSDSDFTIVSLSLEGYHFPTGQIDIQAIALVGNQYPTNIQNGTVYGFEGVISGWSETQTLTIRESQTPTPFPPPTATPSGKYPPSELEVIFGVVVIVVVFALGLGLSIHLLRKQF
jgi:hypothetical protein